MIYLASPYMHADEAVKAARWSAAVDAAIWLMAASGEAVFSPIAHSHHMHVRSGGEIGGDWTQWAEFDTAIIAACSRFVVLRLDGWEASRGIKAEAEIATALGIAIEYMEPA